MLSCYELTHVLWLMVQVTDGKCATCGAAFAAEHVVALNGTLEQVQALRQRLDLRKARKLLKGSRKKRKLQTGAAQGRGEPAPPQLQGS